MLKAYHKTIYGLVYCFIIFFTLHTNAQTTKVNELLIALNKTNSDTARLNVMRRLSVAYSPVDPKKKFYYANQYKLLAQKNGIDSVVSAAYLDMGIAYGIMGNLDSALYYFQLGFEKAKQINYEIGIARSYANIGFAYDRLDRKKEAVTSYKDALRIFKKLNIKKSINQNLTNLGSIYFDLGEYRIAEDYFMQVLNNVIKTPQDEIGLGNAFFSLGNVNEKLENLDKSLDYYYKSLRLREKIGDINGISMANWGIAKVYISKKEYSTAINHLNIALNKNKITDNPYQEIVYLISYAESYLGLKDYKNAEKKADLALFKAKKINSANLISQILQLLVDINKTQNKFKEALNYQSAYIRINDSLNTKQLKHDVIKNDLKRINSDNQNLEKKNRLITEKISDYIIVIFIISILLIFLTILSILYYKKSLERKATNTLLTQQKKEIADINEELISLNEELIVQMDLASSQNTQLEKLNQVKNKFFSIVSHDLRSPMNSLKMLFSLFREGDLTQNELNELTIRLEDTIYNTASFLDNLLEWSKSQLDGIIVNPNLISLHKIVENNIRLMDSQIKIKSIIIQNNIDKDIQIFADLNMINVVVRNLLSNAIKFCHPKDSVTFNIETIGENITFSIKDTGPGMSDKDRDNLFNLTHTPTIGTSGERGYHIGLILCKDMIAQNNGTIDLYTKLGEGTTFYITLPSSKTT